MLTWLWARQLTLIVTPACAQDLGPERCEVPCRWAVDEVELKTADMLLGMASFSPSEIQGLQRRHAGQTVALFSMEPIWGCAHAFDLQLGAR